MITRLLFLLLVVATTGTNPTEATSTPNNNTIDLEVLTLDDDDFTTPIQVKIDPFSLVLAPTNNARPLSLVDTETILGILEDQITDYATRHYHGEDDDLNDQPSETISVSTRQQRPRQQHHPNVSFKYAILGLVSIPTHPEEQSKHRESTQLDFSGGIAYFSTKNVASGGVVEVPSSAEMELLVALALSEENNLVKRLQVDFPYITKATLQWQGELELINTESINNGNTGQEQKEQELPSDPSSSSSREVVVDQAVEQPQQGAPSTSTSFKNSTLLIVLVATVAATLAVGILVVVRNRRQSVELWRNGQTNKNGVAVATTMVLDKPSEDDENELRDMNSSGVNNSADDDDSDMGANKTKSQSLHLRDSLRDCSRLLLSTTHTEPEEDGIATTIAVYNNLTNDEEQGGGSVSKSNKNKSILMNRRSNNKRVDDTVDLSNISSSFIGDIVHQEPRSRRAGANNNRSGMTHDHDDDDSLTCPSEFEGNAIVEPNLIPVAQVDLESEFGETHDGGDHNDTSHDHTTRDDDDHHSTPLTPPSQVSSSRSQPTVSVHNSSSFFSSSLSFLYPQTPSAPTTPNTSAAKQESAPEPARDAPPPQEESNPQEGFVLGRFMSSSKNILPMGSWSLSYFGGGGGGGASASNDEEANATDFTTDFSSAYNNNNNNTKTSTVASPRNPKTGSVLTTDVSKGGWSSSGEGDGGYKTDDDNFTLDKAWDPDDNSFNSSQNGTDVFSGIDDDEVQLLKSTVVQSDR